MTSLAAGGSVLLVAITAVVLWPRTYGTQATLVLDGNPSIENPTALAGRIEAALLEREQLATVAMDLPPELRSPDPIGRLRAGIHVQAGAPSRYSVEFRGSDPPSVQRIANRLADRAVVLVPKLTVSADDVAPMKELAARSRAVSEFLTAHPEMTVEQVTNKPHNAAGDGALDLLRTEKQQIELRLLANADDNPYRDEADDPAQLNRRLAEIKATIARREAALRQPRAPASASASPELTAEWRALLSELGKAQAQAATPPPAVTARVTVRAPLPTSPLTPNRLMLTTVAILLSLAAAMVAYVLPRRAQAGRHGPRSSHPARLRSDAPPSSRHAGEAPSASPPPGRSDPPPGRSDPPPRPRSDPPPGPVAPQRPVVLSSSPPAPGKAAHEVKRSITHPGGLAAATADALAATSLPAPPAAPKGTSTPLPGLLGSRPPPGAGSYSVSSSHPPPFDPGGGGRTSVERLRPLNSAHPPPANSTPSRPPAQPTPPAEVVRPAEVVQPAEVARPAAEPTQPHGSVAPLPEPPQIMSRPPALDPEAERWAAHFETVPPPAETEKAPRKRSGRWKTQVMGSMVPLEASSMRDERPPDSEASGAPSVHYVREQPMEVRSSLNIEQREMPFGWTPRIDPAQPWVAALCDAVLQQARAQHLCLAVTGNSGNGKAQLASALALALANGGAKVLLLEADFDDPQLQHTLELAVPSGAGFSQQLTTRRGAMGDRPWIVVRCSPNLQVLAEGRLRSPGLLASEQFGRALGELSLSYQVVVIHAPSVGRLDDLEVIDGLVQGAVLLKPGLAPAVCFGANPLRAVLSP
ncbi:MAG TPA: hypothetical protein VIW29_07385 [Polyangiaceae bacterium]